MEAGRAIGVLVGENLWNTGDGILWISLVGQFMPQGQLSPPALTPPFLLQHFSHTSSDLWFSSLVFGSTIESGTNKQRTVLLMPVRFRSSFVLLLPGTVSCMF